VRQLRTGADFAKLAATYSDADDALKGGDLGWRARDRLPPLFIEAVAPLKQGEVTDPVRSSNGFHIVKMVGKRAPSIMTSAAALP
jgi:peptidyl-prolyl cis-trans isomerase SurA